MNVWFNTTETGWRARFMAIWRAIRGDFDGLNVHPELPCPAYDMNDPFWEEFKKTRPSLLKD